MTDCVLHEDLHARVNPSFLQGSNQFQTRGVADVRQTRIGVATEVALIGQPLRGSVEDGTPLFEFSNSVRTLFGVNLCHPPIIQIFSTLHGVTEVGLPRVAWILVGQCSSCTSLCHDRMRFTQHRFADDSDRCPCTGGFNRCTQTGTSCTDDDDIVLMRRVILGHFRFLPTTCNPSNRTSGPYRHRRRNLRTSPRVESRAPTPCGVH